MSERNNRRILNKIAARTVPGIREVLDALNCINWAIENGCTDPKVKEAHGLLVEASDIFRESAHEALQEAKEICTIKGLIKSGKAEDDDK